MENIIETKNRKRMWSLEYPLENVDPEPFVPKSDFQNLKKYGKDVAADQKHKANEYPKNSTKYL